MKFLLRIFQFVFGSCHHGRMSRVFTIKKLTYRVCFECGQEFDVEAPVMRSGHGTSAQSYISGVSNPAHTRMPAPVMIESVECIDRAADS